MFPLKVISNIPTSRAWLQLLCAMLLTLVSACAVTPDSPMPEDTGAAAEPAPEATPSEPGTVTAPAPEEPTPPPAVSGNAAVVGLLNVARADVEAGRYPGAVASIERALRIEPKNARLWHELAQLRFAQGDFVQAENLAARSNSWAGADQRLRRDNWLLIVESRLRRGDEAGAEAARERARQFEHRPRGPAHRTSR